MSLRIEHLFFSYIAWAMVVMTVKYLTTYSLSFMIMPLAVNFLFPGILVPVILDPKQRNQDIKHIWAGKLSDILSEVATFTQDHD